MAFEADSREPASGPASGPDSGPDSGPESRTPVINRGAVRTGVAPLEFGCPEGGSPVCVRLCPNGGRLLGSIRPVRDTELEKL